MHMMNEARAKELQGRVTAAVRPSPDGRAIDGATQALRELGAMAYEVGSSVQDVYQRLLYDLHYARDEGTYAFRQWLASQVYDIEERHIPFAEHPVALTPQAFGKRLQLEQDRLSPLKHPLFQRLFHEEPALDEVKAYLRHKWLVIMTFWRALAEFGYRLQRTDAPDVALVYKNVYDELGNGDVDAGHLLLHYRQLRGIGLPVSMDDTPQYTESLAYVNNRLRCMRHAELAWGLGSFFSQEATSLQYTMGHYNMLDRHGVPKELTNIYFMHESIDSDHTSEILQVINNLVTTAEAQRVCLASQRHQMALWHRHFDRILADLPGLEQRTG